MPVMLPMPVCDTPVCWRTDREEGRIERRKVLGGLIDEYRRAA
ncbi:hypothetical protein [Planomonospora alba]